MLNVNNMRIGKAKLARRKPVHSLFTSINFETTTSLPNTSMLKQRATIYKLHSFLNQISQKITRLKQI